MFTLPFTTTLQGRYYKVEVMDQDHTNRKWQNVGWASKSMLFPLLPACSSKLLESQSIFQRLMLSSVGQSTAFFNKSENPGEGKQFPPL